MIEAQNSRVRTLIVWPTPNELVSKSQRGGDQHLLVLVTPGQNCSITRKFPQRRGRDHRPGDDLPSHFCSRPNTAVPEALHDNSAVK